jgi:hypothetical protein
VTTRCSLTEAFKGRGNHEVLMQKKLQWMLIVMSRSSKATDIPKKVLTMSTHSALSTPKDPLNRCNVLEQQQSNKQELVK